MHNDKIIDEITSAIGAHGAWKLRLRTAISHGSSDVTPEIVAKDDQCAFGKWLHGSSLDADIRAGKPYEVVQRLHADFHRCAGDVLRKAVSGQARDANTLFEGEFTERSQILVTALTKWKGELQRGR